MVCVQRERLDPIHRHRKTFDTHAFEIDFPGNDSPPERSAPPGLDKVHR